MVPLFPHVIDSYTENTLSEIKRARTQCEVSIFKFHHIIEYIFIL